MNIPEIWRRIKQSFYSVPTSYFGAGGYGGYGGGPFGMIRESYTGAWQQNVTCETRENVLAFSAVFSCATLISSDISKLRPKLMSQSAEGIWQETQAAAFSPVLRKPNGYQTRIQFLERWMLSKLLWGNAYILKVRDQSGIVRRLYVLDPRTVTPQLTEDGGVYYYVSLDFLNTVDTLQYFPSSEIIHDRGPCLFHPLIGVSAIYACGASATQGIRVQAQAAKFWENMARPSGQLTSDKTIDDATAARLKAQFEDNFRSGNMGRIMIAGDNLKFEPLGMPPVDAQLVAQLEWTAKDVARAFRVPLYKIGAEVVPARTTVAALNQEYYSQTLQNLIECIELLLDEGLGLPSVPGQTYGVELDLDGLLRMDQLTFIQALGEAVKNGIMSPNEARLRLDLPKVPGGQSPYLQQQNYSLAALDKRDSAADPFATNAPAGAPALPAPGAPPAPALAEPSGSPAAKDLAAMIIARFSEPAFG